MSKIFLLLLFFTVISNAQNNTIDYIAYSDNTYYEILKNKKDITVIKYYINKSSLARDTLHFISVKEVQQKLHFKTLLKTRKLQKESTFFRNVDLGRSQQEPNLGDLANTEILEKDWYLHKRVGLNFKTDTLYTFQFHENGNKELWYLSGNDSLDLYNRFWCKHKKQPVFIPIHHENFDVILVQRHMKLSLIYYDKKKGIQGNIRF